MSRLRGEQRELGVDISSDEEGNNWDDYVDEGIAHPPLKKARVGDEGVVRSSDKTPRDKVGVKDETVSVLYCFFFSFILR